MRKERRTLTGAFKAKVALEALQEKKTIAQLAAEYDLHSNQVSAWKKQLVEQSSHVFEQPHEVKDNTAEKLQEELFKQIGQLRVENEWLKKNLHSFLDKSSRKKMIDKSTKHLTLTRQCQLAGINKSSLYYQKRAEPAHNIELMNRMDKISTTHPYYGARRIQYQLQRDGNAYNIKRIRRLMYKMGIITQYPKRNLSKAAPGHKKYPYLLRGMNITQNNQVWSIDITYVPMEKGFMYLVAVIDWHSRYILSWRLSNTMTVEFCKECLQEAIDNYGSPKIFNSDQGSQFTSEKFTNVWQENKLQHVQISMDGRGRATDNAFIERVWRSVKQEKIYAGKFENGTELWLAITEYFNFYNHDRPRQALKYNTPSQTYQPKVLNILTDTNKEKVTKRNLTTSITNQSYI